MGRSVYLPSVMKPCSQVHEMSEGNWFGARMGHACCVFLAGFTLRRNRVSNCAHHLRYLCCWYLLVLIVIMGNNGFKMPFIASVLQRLLHCLSFSYNVPQRSLNLPSEVVHLEADTQIQTGFPSTVRLGRWWRSLLHPIANKSEVHLSTDSC